VALFCHFSSIDAVVGVGLLLHFFYVAESANDDASRWLRFAMAKIGNPLFSGTWWVRLCNFACKRAIPKTATAPISGAAPRTITAPMDPVIIVP
jgi:hypothetical protein